MVANVLFVIIPGQRELVRAKQQGRDAGSGAGAARQAAFGPQHLFHAAGAVRHDQQSLCDDLRRALQLAGTDRASASPAPASAPGSWPVTEPGRSAALRPLLSALLAAGVAGGSGSRARGTGGQAWAPPACSRVAASGEAAQVQHIVQLRCVPCHAATTPTQAGFSAAPNGLVLETLEQLSAHLPQVQQQLVARTMPLGNLTAMTDQERSAMLTWIGQGARHRAELLRHRSMVPESHDYPRDLVGYGRHPPHARWPGEARIALQFVLNYEEGAENCVLDGDPASEVFLSEIVGAQAFPDASHEHGVAVRIRLARRTVAGASRVRA